MIGVQTLAVDESRRETRSARPGLSLAARARAVRDLLREAGLEESMVRRLVTTLIQSQAWADVPRSAWWQSSPMSSSLHFLPADRQREMDNLTRELLGDDLDSRTMSFLDLVAADKQAAVRTIMRDYADLQSEVYTSMRDFQMPEDQQRLQFLNEEMRKDLRALLGEEDYNRIAVQWAPAGNRAKMVAAQLDLTEAEFWQVYALRQALDSESSLGETPATSKAREERFDTQLAELFGDERIAASALRASRDYQVLEKARQRLGFSQATFDQVLALRERAAAGSGDVAGATLSTAEKKTALRDLAGSIRSELDTLLGPEIAKAYLQQNGMNWISGLERGQAVRLMPSGYADSYPVK